MSDATTAESVNTTDRWIGTVVLNGDVAGTIRRYGAVAHSKPHGPGKMILYYENPNWDGTSEEVGGLVDYAGEITPGGIQTVTNQPMGTSLNHGASVSFRTRIAGAGPQTGIGNQNTYVNPNTVTRSESSITNPEHIDQAVVQAETKNVADRDNKTARDKIVGEGRSDMSGALSATPFMGPTTHGRPAGAARIEALDQRQIEAIRGGLASEDAGLRQQAADVVLNLIPVLPSPPAESEAGTIGHEAGLRGGPSDDAMIPASEASTGSPQATENAGSQPSEPTSASGSGPVESGGGGLVEKIKDAASSVVETVKDVLPGPSSQSPREKLAEAHPEWNYAFLSAKDKGELEELADEAEKLSVTVERVDGKTGPLRKEDYIAALRTDVNKAE